MKKLDRNLEKALQSYSPYDDNSDSQIQLLVENNLFLGTKRISHDESIEWLSEEFKKSKKSKIVNDFLIGVQEGIANLRAGLSAYAIATKFPYHKFIGNDVCCDICGGFKGQTVDLTFINAIRHTYGSLMSGTPEDLAFFLQESNKITPLPLQNTNIFSEIMHQVARAAPNDTPSTLLKKIYALPNIKMKKDEIRGFLETLGYAGILHAPPHLGYIYEFTRPGTAPKKSRSSDWSYPFDFWKGEFGVNREALGFWFSDYPELVSSI